jgi:ABC-type Fe3+/spermidine/putrescine transport system ATPase subunit
VAPQGSSRLPMVRLDRVWKTYPTAAMPALEDLSLEIHQGELFVLLGPSGCGKTTSLRIVAGLEMPDCGAVFLQDQPIVDTDRRLFVPAHKRNLGMVCQSYGIWPHMTVEENVVFPLDVRRMPSAMKRERVNEVLELVGLVGLHKRPAPLLSGGQQQRVALARALVYEPRLLILDEPFSNLDRKLREQMQQELKLLQARVGITVLFVTHDQVEALSLADRVAVIAGGRLQQVGTAREVYTEPSNAFVRDFVGKTFLLKGKVQAEMSDGRLAVGLHGEPPCVVLGRSPEPGTITDGADVLVAARPEDVGLSPWCAGPCSGIPGTIASVQFVGERTEYRVRLQRQGEILVYGRPREVFEEGQKVVLHLPGEALSVWRA